MLWRTRQGLRANRDGSLANIEMRLILAKMIWWFDLELMPECRNWPGDQFIYTTWEKIPLKIKVTPVKR